MLPHYYRVNSRTLHFSLHWLWLLLALFGAQAVQAQTLSLQSLPSGSLGLWTSQLQESGQELNLPAAQAYQRQGAFHPGVQTVPSFGIDAPPVWLHLSLDNRNSTPVSRRLQVGMPWTDHLDVYLVQDGRLLAHWVAGDANPGARKPEPGLGYIFDLGLPGGPSELFIRAASSDPLALPVQLLSPQQAAAADTWNKYSYGFLYGFLLALIAYNSMLYAGLRDRSHLDYSLYLGVFVLTSLGYTGHGYAWLWPDYPYVQRYVVLILMVLFSSAGLRFASHFLALPQHAPTLHRLTKLFSVGTLLLIGLCTLFDWKSAATLTAFTVALLFTLTMAALGLFAVRHGQAAARYFLAAVQAGMIGVAITDLAVWGVIPLTPWTYRAAEIGLLLEATLLALALAYQVRRHQQARLEAEQLARIDPLTGLHNRRALLEQGAVIWSTVLRKQRPLAVIMLDIDHFKNINDQHGHPYGDRVLVAVGELLQHVARAGDITARWGGEEFVLLLPETNLKQACALAERLRQKISTLLFDNELLEHPLTASLGVAQHRHQSLLNEVIAAADSCLYRAKQQGRNRVCSAEQEDVRQQVDSH